VSDALARIRQWARTPRPLIVAGIVGAAATLSFRPIYEPDLWWHLAQGRENATGHVVRTNLFSFNYPDYRQQYTSWLFDTSAFLAWTAGGPTMIQMLQAVVLALTFGLVYLTCRIRSSVASAAAVLIVGFFILEPRAIPRPHLISFAGLAACALLFERASIRRSAVPLWWCVPVIALWSNIHVECIFGVAFVALVAATESVRSGSLPSEEGRRTFAIALACVVATLVNPYGWGLLQYAYENCSVPQALDIAELQRPPLFAYRAFYVYLAGCAAVLIWQWRSVTLREVVTITAFCGAGPPLHTPHAARVARQRADRDEAPRCDRTPACRSVRCRVRGGVHRAPRVTHSGPPALDRFRRGRRRSGSGGFLFVAGDCVCPSSQACRARIQQS
jgi:hypothetical protein